jgi:hypothetical protein
MAPSIQGLPTDYLAAARGVVQAGRAFGDGIDGNRAQANAVATRLERRLGKLGAGPSAAGDLGFSGASARRGPDQPEPTPDELLTRALIDLQAGRLAVAAGSVAGELGEPSGRDEYNDALVALELTTSTIERAPESLGFGARRKREHPRSPDLESARASFEKEATAVLDVVVEGTAKVATTIVDHVKGLPGAKTLADLLAKATQWQQALPGLGRLVKLGLAQLNRALLALLRLLKLDRVEQVHDRLAAYWERLTADGLKTGLVREATGVPGAQQRVASALAAGPRDLDSIDEASDALRGLADSFKSRVQLVDRVLAALALAAGVLGLVVGVVAAVNPYVIGLSAAAYLLLLTWVLLTARDHTDSGLGIERMRGVTAIADGLAHS